MRLVEQNQKKKKILKLKTRFVFFFFSYQFYAIANNFNDVLWGNIFFFLLIDYII